MIRKLTLLVQDSEDSEDDLEDLGAPAAANYKSHGGSILDMLEDLKQKAEMELTTLRKEEQNAQHNFEMLKASLLDQIKAGNKEMDEAKASKNLAAQVQAVSKGDMAVNNKELASDMKSMKNLKIDCKAVAGEYEVSQKSSAEEKAAIDGGLEALKKVGDTGAASSFVQLHSRPGQFEVVNILRKLAQVERSAALTQLAGRVSTAMTLGASRGSDPFQKVKEMLTGMVAKLQKEAGSEAKHEAWCAKEQKDSKEKKSDLGEGIGKFTARIDKAKAKAAGLKGEVSTLQEELSDIAAEQGEAVALRREQAANYKTTKADLEQGFVGVRAALKMLRKYYETPEFLQKPALATAHASSSGTATSVISMLELVQSDMDKKLSSIEYEETSEAAAYKKLSEDNAEAKLIKEQTVKYKTKETTSLEKYITEYASDLDGEQSQMDAVRQYASNIKSMCDTTSKETYEERSARRTAEVEGLKDALKTLEGQQAAALVQKSALRGATVAKHA